MSMDVTFYTKIDGEEKVICSFPAFIRGWSNNFLLYDYSAEYLLRAEDIDEIDHALYLVDQYDYRRERLYPVIAILRCTKEKVYCRIE